MYGQGELEGTRSSSGGCRGKRQMGGKYFNSIPLMMLNDFFIGTVVFAQTTHRIRSFDAFDSRIQSASLHTPIHTKPHTHTHTLTLTLTLHSNQNSIFALVSQLYENILLTQIFGISLLMSMACAVQISTFAKQLTCNQYQKPSTFTLFGLSCRKILWRGSALNESNETVDG